jgi:glutamyl-tRNA synthetase
MPGLKERAKTLVDLLNSARYLFARRPLSYDKKATKLLNDETRTTLGQLAQAFEALDDWTVETLEQVVREFAEEKELKLGKIAQPLRAALTGCTVSPGIFDVLFVLGKEESLARIGDL